MSEQTENQTKVLEAELQKLRISVLYKIAAKTISKNISRTDIEELSKELTSESVLRRLKITHIYDYASNVFAQKFPRFGRRNYGE